MYLQWVLDSRFAAYRTILSGNQRIDTVQTIPSRNQSVKAILTMNVAGTSELQRRLRSALLIETPQNDIIGLSSHDINITCSSDTGDTQVQIFQVAGDLITSSLVASYYKCIHAATLKL